jgi:hypothetical protein
MSHPVRRSSSMSSLPTPALAHKTSSTSTALSVITSTNPKPTASSLTGRAVTKLDNRAIFDCIRSKMCMIKGPAGKTSGFFINESGLLVTTFHCLTKTLLAGGQFSVNPNELTVFLDGKEYKVKFPPDFDASKANELDLCLLQIQSHEKIKTSCFELLPTSLAPAEGMKTYFAGFPLTQTAITFHKGLLSFFQANGSQYFTIDGTVVPGNSGGPVVIQHEGEVYLAGVIFAEAADINPDFRQQKNHIIGRLKDATASISGVPLNLILAEKDRKFKHVSPLFTKRKPLSKEDELFRKKAHPLQNGLFFG